MARSAKIEHYIALLEETMLGLTEIEGRVSRGQYDRERDPLIFHLEEICTVDIKARIYCGIFEVYEEENNKNKILKLTYVELWIDWLYQGSNTRGCDFILSGRDVARINL